jgi:DNA-binding NtrC family response regulator
MDESSVPRSPRTILVVDDEPNALLTLEEALAPLGHRVVTSASGAEAIAALADRSIELVLLDLKMPGVDGMGVLRHIERERPGVRVVIVTAHGTVDAAVQSMKLGALDLIQKPCSLADIRALVVRLMDLEARRAGVASAYDDLVRRARGRIQERSFDAAEELIRRALDCDSNRPEAHNLEGVVDDLRGRRDAARRHWRVALDLDPAYGPAQSNLHRTARASLVERGAPDLGE